MNHQFLSHSQPATHWSRPQWQHFQRPSYPYLRSFQPPPSALLHFTEPLSEIAYFKLIFSLSVWIFRLMLEIPIFDFWSIILLAQMIFWIWISLSQHQKRKNYQY
jgi:hypothetical protein